MLPLKHGDTSHLTKVKYSRATLYLKDFSIPRIAKQKLHEMSMFSQLRCIVLFCRKQKTTTTIKKKTLSVGRRGLVPIYYIKSMSMSIYNVKCRRFYFRVLLGIKEKCVSSQERERNKPHSTVRM